MADLGERGQIVLVGAFALAVIFVALALVVNSAIFTENLATRGETTGGSEALLDRHQTEENVRNVIGGVNDRTTAVPVTEVNRSMENMSRQGGIQNAEGGRIVTATVNDGSEYLSARLFQENDSRTYENESGEADWTLASEATRVRRAEFNVSTGALLNVSKTDRDDAFNFVIDDGNDAWNVSVYEPQNASEDVNVTVSENGTELGTCSANGAFVTINVTNGSMAGTPCPALDGPNRAYTGYPVNTTSFENADEVRGTYSIALEIDESAKIDAGNYNVSASPIADVDVEYLDVTYLHETARLQYETTFTVGPGESG